MNYLHGFHAGNHADVLKHLVLVQLLQHLNQKEKGYRVIDTHAGAGAYSLRSEQANKKLEWLEGIGRIYERKDLPKGVADYLNQVEAFNGPGVLKNVPGSPTLIRQLLRPQDELQAYEVHPTDLRALEKLMAEHKGVKVHLADGFTSLKAMLPPPSRRGLLLIDPSYELKTDYARVLAAVREALKLTRDASVSGFIANNGTAAKPVADATGQAKIDDVMAEGLFRNHGNGWAFFDPFSNAFVQDAGGNIMTWTTDDFMLMRLPDEIRPPPGGMSGNGAAVKDVPAVDLSGQPASAIDSYFPPAGAN